MKVKTKKVMLIVLAIITMFSATFPAAAESFSENIVPESASKLFEPNIVQERSSITVPFNFDGSKPDISEVVVQNTQEAAPMQELSLFSAPLAEDNGAVPLEDGLPKRQVTNMPSATTSEAAITVVTADRYFLYSPVESEEPKRQFMAQFEGEFADQLSNGTCYAILADTNSETTEAGIRTEINRSNNKSYTFIPDISDIVVSDTTVYLSVWQESFDGITPDSMLYGPVAINVNYVEDILSVDGSCKYLRSDVENFSISLNIPEEITNEDQIDVSLVSSSGKVVAKRVNEISDYIYINYSPYYADERYESIFEANHLFNARKTYISTSMNRAAEIVPGNYGIKLSVNGVENTYPNLIQVVNDPVVRGLYSGSSYGFPPPVIGGNQAYIYASIDGGKKDDFEVSILDSNNNEIGTSVESKYIYEDTYVYKVILNDGVTFETEQNYSINLSYAGNLYFTGSENSNLYPYDGFEIYDYSFSGDNTTAIFDLKGVNMPEETTPIELGLLNMRDELIGTATVIPAALMANVQFKDESGNVVSLTPNNGYEICLKVDGDWEYMVYFYVSQSSPNSQNTNKSELFSKYYIYLNQNSYEFDIALRKDLNEITDSSEYVVSLKNNNGDIVGTLDGNLVKQDITIYYGQDQENEIPCINLLGTLALSKGGLSEGIYDLTVVITDGPNSRTVSESISVISEEKVYATYSYPSIESTDTGYTIVGSAHMLKKDTAYESSKFSYELTDLLGNLIGLGPIEVTHYSHDWWYPEIYDISAPITADIPAAYYFLKLKYDGKDIYNLSNPTEMLFSGYNSYDSIPLGMDFSWYPNENDACYAIDVKGVNTDNAIITATIYDSENVENFTPVKTVTLSSDDNNTRKFIFTEESLIGIDANKEYDTVFFYNGNCLGVLNNTKIGTENVESVPVTGINLGQNTLAIKVGETKNLHVSVEPPYASNTNVTWSSDKPSVATVDENTGLITGISAGTAVITVTTEDGGFTAQCTVTVEENIATIALTKLAYDNDSEITKSNEIYEIDGSKYPLHESKPLKMTFKGTNYNASKNYNYAITFNNDSALAINGTALGSEFTSGKVIDLVRDSGLVDGSYNCSIIIKDNSTQVAAASFTLNITGTPIPVTGVTLSKSRLSLTAGKTASLIATVSPSTATNKKVTWSSSDTSVATVDASTGLITAIGAGSATMMATTEDGEKTATCLVNVGIKVTGTLKYGETPANDTWLALYNNLGIFVTSVYADKDGKFLFDNLLVGSYDLRAYSPDSSYRNLEYDFTVATGDTNKELGSITFESKYANRATLTVNVKKLAQATALDTDFTVYIYNYETGVSKSANSTTANPGVVSFSDLPYLSEGTSYYVSLYTGEATDYYYDTETVNVIADTATVEFNVPVTYKISGTVKATDDTLISYTNVKATDNSTNNTYWGYSNENGAYVIHGLSNGTYTLSVEDQKYRTTSPASITINNESISIGADITVQKGLTVMGKALKNGIPAYKAYVVLYDSQNNYIAGGYSTGADGFVFDGAIKDAGTYKLMVSGIYNQNGTWQNYESDIVTIEVTAENLAAGRLVVDATYKDPSKASDIFTGSGNMVLTNIGLVRNGSNVDLVIKYKNNGNTPVDADFTVDLPTGVTNINGDTTFSVNDLAAGASGKQSLSFEIGSLNNINNITIPVEVKIGDVTYDFGLVSLDVANITLTGPEAVKSTESFKIYGEATANSSITIKNALTGEVLGTAVPNGRWYSVQITALSEGTYNIVAEATKDGITVVSQILKVESKADQITVNTVTTSSTGSADLPVNKLIGVRAFTAWVGPDLDGRDINIGAKFGNDSSITNVTYRFADRDYIATKDSNGIWNANITGWSGAGLKTITATVTTSDNRTLKFIIAEVTILIDPSGYITDSESNERLGGVTVVCEVLNGSGWDVWDAEPYGQINPQLTDVDGKYGWMVPAGTYRVKALKNGYDAYSTTEDPSFSDLTGNSTIVIPPIRTDVIFKLTPSILVTDISLNTTSAAITVGNTLELTSVVTPEDATNSKNVKWTSDNTAVATVSNGIITAVSAGTAIITAKVGSHSETCTVTVSGTSNPPYIPGGGVVYPAPVDLGTDPVLDVDASGQVEIRAGQLEKAESLTIKGDTTLTFDRAAVEAIKAMTGDIVITVKKSDKKLSEDAKSIIGSRPVYDFDVSVGGKEVSDFKGGNVKIEIPYSADSSEDINAIVIYYIDAKGNLNVINNCVYDKVKKIVTFKTTHFSTYAVGYNKTEFSDVSGWATDAITFLSARGIISGVGNNSYAPSNNITRADFAVILAKIAGVDLSKFTASRFADVKETDRYSKAIEWAADNGIVSGVGNNRYAPKAFITRQDMALMITKFAKVMKHTLPEIVEKSDFADQDAINSYALDAAEAVQKAGIISGKVKKGESEYCFAPKDNATRAEAAQMLSTLLKGMAK